MREKLHLGVIVLLAISVGVLGTLVVQGRTAEAQHPSGFRECFFLRGDPGWSHMHNPEHLRNPVGRFPVPSGWTVVSGQLGGQQVANSVLICR